jgi:hypothetical protein
VSKIRERILRGEGAHGTLEEIGEWMIESIEKWTPEQKAAARTNLDRWHAGTIWDRENPTRPYDREFRN